VKAGFIRKTGVPLTDQATIDWRFFRHGDVLTVLMVATDPVYLVEPEIVSKSFRMSRTPLDYRAECVTAYEGHEPGDSVPHFAPDQNPFADEFLNLYHLPREAVLGYRETLYPEYRKKIKDPTSLLHRAPNPVGLPATSSCAGNSKLYLAEFAESAASLLCSVS
jgi:hypothetical protein